MNHNNLANAVGAYIIDSQFSGFLLEVTDVLGSGVNLYNSTVTLPEPNLEIERIYNRLGNLEDIRTGIYIGALSKFFIGKVTYYQDGVTPQSLITNASSIEEVTDDVATFTPCVGDNLSPLAPNVGIIVTEGSKFQTHSNNGIIYINNDTNHFEEGTGAGAGVYIGPA